MIGTGYIKSCFKCDAGVKSGFKPDVRLEVKSVVKPDVKSGIMSDIKSDVRFGITSDTTPTEASYSN